ncbi:alpha/beta fold hydrolase [Pseudenhygromyxa sp. WMMC2535]|nr:alpha/beta fold hydrolase [Pseudenhygromyxa sp. WMMC2535]NVB40742.1 alpha/beta fold hydrolase [Pseudenhygromyxa sp. WMMC2535]
MVHGNPTWSFYWRNLILALRDTHRVIAPDHMGCGRSDKPSAEDYDYTLRSRIADLGALIDHLELRDITLVVHDWGGGVGFGWAVDHPDRVVRMVVLNTAAFHLPAGKSFPAALSLARIPGLGAALVRGANAFVRGANRFCVTRRPLPPEVAAGYIEPYRSWSDRVAVHRFVTDIPLRPEDPAYAIIEATQAGLSRLADKPMFIGWGMRDFVFDHHFLAEWERHFPAAEVHRFPDCGHYILEDAREELVPEIALFIRAGAVEGAGRDDSAEPAPAESRA